MTSVNICLSLSCFQVNILMKYNKPPRVAEFQSQLASLLKQKLLLFMPDIQKTYNHLQSAGNTAQNTGHLEAYRQIWYRNIRKQSVELQRSSPLLQTKTIGPREEAQPFKKAHTARVRKTDENKLLTSQVHFQSVAREIRQPFQKQTLSNRIDSLNRPSKILELETVLLSTSSSNIIPLKEESKGNNVQVYLRDCRISGPRAEKINLWQRKPSNRILTSNTVQIILQKHYLKMTAFPLIL